MQFSTLLVRSILPFIATPAFAAIDANSCATQSSKLKPYERNAFIISCLTQLNTSASIKQREQQNKKALCEQNVKNLNLHGSGQSKYLATCMNANEAEVAAMASKAPSKTTTNNVVHAQEKKKKAAQSSPVHTETQVKPTPKLQSKSKPKSKHRTARNKKREATEPPSDNSALAM
jgi:hypothetical protein